MKEKSLTEAKVVSIMNPIQEKICLLTNNGFTWKVVAALTELPKKLIKKIATGKIVPTDEECNWLGKKFDDSIADVGITARIYDNEPCPEADLDTEGYECHMIGIKSMSFYKSRDDDKMILQIHGTKIYD